MARAPQEVFAHHVDDAVFISPAGATFAVDGSDTFVSADGLIQVQTVRYTVQHRG